MLARNPSLPDSPDLEFFVRTLRLPAKPQTVKDADEALRRATAAREEAQQRHVEAGRQLSEQKFGQAPTITRAEVDEIGAELVPLMTAEAEAKARRDTARAEHSAALHAELERPLHLYEQAIADKITELEDLLAAGCALRADAVSAGVRLSSKLPGICPSMITHLQGLRVMLRRIS